MLLALGLGLIQLRDLLILADNILKVLKDNLPGLLEGLRKLDKNEVLVGVPNDTTNRKDSGTEMTNATLAYLHDNGSPVRNIPARPFMEPGIKSAKEAIAENLRFAADRFVAGGTSQAKRDLNKVGLIAQSAIRSKINEGIAPALTKSTLAARRKRGRTGTKPLVDTGQLRNSITYVLREK